MSVQSYWTFILVATVVAGASWATVIALIDPVSGGTQGVLLFFASALLSLCGVGMMVSLRIWCGGGRCATNHHRLARALRHGVLVGVLATAMLAMQFAQIWTWWTGLMVLGLIVLVELYAVLVTGSKTKI